LKDEQHNRAGNRQAQSSDRQGELKPGSDEEKKTWEVLEQARQDVKFIVKKELEAEIVTNELLNLRVRNSSR
jgi:hypothetical protein